MLTSFLWGRQWKRMRVMHIRKEKNRWRDEERNCDLVTERLWNGLKCRRRRRFSINRQTADICNQITILPGSVSCVRDASKAHLGHEEWRSVWLEGRWTGLWEISGNECGRSFSLTEKNAFDDLRDFPGIEPDFITSSFRLRKVCLRLGTGEWKGYATPGMSSIGGNFVGF